MQRTYLTWGGIALVLVAIVALQGNGSLTLRELEFTGSSGYDASDDYAVGLMDSKTTRTMYADSLETAGSTAADVAQRIIKTADLTLQVDVAADSAQAIADIAKAKGGYVQSSSVSEDAVGNKYAHVTIRVPVDHFEAIFDEVKDLADKVVNASTNGQDVTEQYTDLEARLNAAKAQEQQYLTILQLASTVGEILAVQEHLADVRADIESMQGQLNYLTNRTELATISVSLTENTRVTIPTEKFELWDEIKDAAKTLIVVFQRIVTAVVWAIIVGGPFALLALGAYTIYRRRSRR